MRKPRLIALCSPAMGSGKSTVANHLIANHRFMPVAFATPLKAMTMALFEALDMDGKEARDRVFGHRKEEMIPILDVTSRQVQQRIGTEFGRNSIRESIWTDIAMGVAGKLMADGYNVVIDDMRFPNEYHAVLAAGGTPWRIRRPAATVTSQHVSEGQLDGITMETLHNIHGIPELLKTVDATLAASSFSL